MKRTLALLGALMLCATLAGCSTDPREGLVDAAVQDLNTAATKVTTINTKIKEAFDKSPDSPDFKEVLNDIGGLKNIASDMKAKRTQANQLKSTTTPEERQELAKQVKVKLNEVITRLSKANAELDETIKAHNRETLKVVLDKLLEANSEFQAISLTQ